METPIFCARCGRSLSVDAVLSAAQLADKLTVLGWSQAPRVATGGRKDDWTCPDCGSKDRAPLQ